MTYIYPCLTKYIRTGAVDLERHSIKGMLVIGYNPEKTHKTRADVASFEIRGQGYSVGGIKLEGQLIGEDDDGEFFTANPVEWPKSTIKSSGIILYRSRGGILAEDELVCYVGFGEQNSRNGPFAIEWHQQGIFGLLTAKE